ncbi:MAG: hypothetical protein Fur0037_23050 [Planctomycetota bacterium]
MSTRRKKGGKPESDDLGRREAAFAARLLPRLRDCEAGFGTMLFHLEDASSQLPCLVRDPDAQELLCEASAIVAIREQRGLSADCLARRYIDACASASAPEPRMGPRRLASELLRWFRRQDPGERHETSCG